jgi:hypothetical protein
LDEIIRVLKPEGKANLFPLAYMPIPKEEKDEHYPAHYDDDPNFFDKIIKTLIDKYEEAISVRLQNTGIARPSLVNAGEHIEAKKLLIKKMKSLKQ